MARPPVPAQGLGRPRTVRSIRVLMLRLARENLGGDRRVRGELLVLGVKVAAPTIWEILHEAGTVPAPERGSATWAVPAFPGIQTVRSGVRMPRMNSIMERWVQTCRRELLDRTLIWNQATPPTRWGTP